MPLEFNKNVDNSLYFPRVIPLEDSVIDQIAAGEVLERPAHMVKELIENAIDASATEVELHLGEGGRSLTLIDNGVGFNPEDLTLALQRHTTSKLKQSSDLWDLSTYGFRGEALASIAAVSKMNIRTHRRGEKCVELQSEFGKVTAIVDSSLDYGTRIEISDLYQNMPARLKFLKTDATEVLEIKKVLYAFGLCQPFVSLKLFYRDRLEFFWPAAKVNHAGDLDKNDQNQFSDKQFNQDDLNSDHVNRKEIEGRSQNILETKELYLHKKIFGDISVEVHLAPPHETAKSNRKLWVFVQKRWVQEPMILSAIRDGFQNSLLPQEYPIGAVFVEVPKDFVDVNVHPTKSKVKFKDQSVIYRAVRNCILDFVESSPWRQGFLNQETSLKNDTSYSANDSIYNHYSDFLKSEGYLDSPKHQTGFELKAYRSSNESDPMPSPSYQFSESKPKENFLTVNLNTVSIQVPSSSPEVLDYVTTSKPDKENLWANLVVIGQVAKTYIVTQNQSEIIYIDQHAAHERCLFEKLWQRFKKGEALETQRHLIPLTFRVDDESWIEAFLKNQSGLERLGIRFEQSGPTQIELIETPAMIKDSAVLKSLSIMTEQILETGQSFVFEDVVSDIFATQACHSAIRAGQILSIAEMEELLDLMDDYSTTSYCPHGRPVFVRHTFSQLEKEFFRKI